MKAKKIREYTIKQRMVACENEEIYAASIGQPSDARRVALAVLGESAQERFLVLIMDIKNKVLGYVETARGGVDSCAVDPREVFRSAIMLGASSIIVAHCHPSGNTQPSNEDIKLTKDLKTAGKILGISVLDHLIVSTDSTYSMQEHGEF